MNNKQQVIDVWAQPLEDSFIQLMPEVYELSIKSKSQMGKGISIEQHIKLLDKGNVQKVLLSSWHRPGQSVISNDKILEYTNAYPNRFYGVCSVDLNNPVEACQVMDKYVKNHGFKALRVVPWLWNKPPNTNLYYPLFAKCVELDIPFCTQVGHTGPLCPSETGRPIPYLDEVALTFPQLKIVAGHIGYPWTYEMIALAWKYKNVYIDTSAYLPRYYPSELIHFMKTYGQDKVMFGTNFPQLSWDECVKQVDQLGLSEEVKAKFLYKNAERVFKLNSFENKPKL